MVQLTRPMSTLCDLWHSPRNEPIHEIRIQYQVSLVSLDYITFIVKNSWRSRISNLQGQDIKFNQYHMVWQNFIFCRGIRVILCIFQRIYLVGFADNVSKERQYKGYCLISNASDSWKCALDY